MSEKTQGEELKERLFNTKKNVGQMCLMKKKKKYLIIAQVIWIF